MHSGVWWRHVLIRADRWASHMHDQPCQPPPASCHYRHTPNFRHAMARSAVASFRQGRDRMALSEEKMAPTQSVDAMTAGCGLARSAVASFRQGRDRMALSEEKMAPTQSVDAMTAGCGLARSAVASFCQGRNRSASPVEKMADEG
jgi:hypothetical protein